MTKSKKTDKAKSKAKPATKAVKEKKTTKPKA